MGNVERVIQAGVDVLEGEPKGLRYTDLFKRIYARLPGVPEGTVKTQTNKLATKKPNEV